MHTQAMKESKLSSQTRSALRKQADGIVRVVAGLNRAERDGRLKVVRVKAEGAGRTQRRSLSKASASR